MPEPDLEPIPGSSRTGLVATSVLLVLAGSSFVSVAIASLFTPGLGGAVVLMLIFTAVSAITFVAALSARRNYLRDVRNGKVVIRRPWTGESLGPPG